jgi:hypothetical protein
MAAKKTKKSLKPKSAPAASKLNLVALKPLVRTPETQTSSPSSVEPSEPVEPSTSVEPPTSVDAPSSVEPSLPVGPPTSVDAPSSVEPSLPVGPPTSVDAPSSVEPSLPVETSTSVETPTHLDEIDPSLPENKDAIFQAIGIIAGEVAFSGKKTFVTIADKQYRLFYSSTRKKAFEALKSHITSTGQSRQRLIVYPKVIHFQSRSSPTNFGFQFVGFVSDNVTQVTRHHTAQEFDYR